MKIQKFNQFILEAQDDAQVAPQGEAQAPEQTPMEQPAGNVRNDTPASYVDSLLIAMKKKVEKMFEENDDEDVEENDIKKAKLNKKRNGNSPTFKEFNLRLESCEVSTRSLMNDTLTVKFSDDENWYNLLISVSNKDAIPKDKTKDFSTKDIKQCFIKFKKYDSETQEVIGQITRNTDPNTIDEEFIVNLKIELDDQFGEEEEFEIET
jgi:hypothetical protein